MSTLEQEPAEPQYKYQRWANELRLKIHRGEILPGEQLPSQNEMKEIYGLSRPTTERAYALLEEDGLVVRDSNKGIFVADQHSRQLTNLIGVGSCGLSEVPRARYWSQLQAGILEVTAREEKGMLLLDENSSTGWDKVDGVILGDIINARGEEVITKLPSGLPRVSVLLSTPGVACVTVDDYTGGQIATQHLLSLGHRKIAYLADPHHPMLQRRIAGYRGALLAAGIEPDPAWMRSYPQQYPSFQPSFNQADNSSSVMRDWLENDWKSVGCTAILAMNDHAASGIIKTLQERGIAVPEQVSVVGFDNDELCDFITPRLTSVEVPLREIGKMAMEILLRQIETGQASPSITMMPVRLAERESTAVVM